MKDITGVELQIGDKVVATYSQAFRIGKVLGFTSKKVKVGFDYSINGDVKDEDLVDASLSPWKVAKVYNQDTDLRGHLDDVQEYIDKRYTMK